MPIEVDWGNQDETLLTMKIKGDWTAEELYQAQTDMLAMSQSKTHTVDAIVDMRTANLKMNGLLPVARQALRRRPRNIGTTAVITHTNFWQRIFQSLPATLLNDFHVIFVNEVDEAYTVIDDARNARQVT